MKDTKESAANKINVISIVKMLFCICKIDFPKIIDFLNAKLLTINGLRFVKNENFEGMLSIGMIMSESIKNNVLKEIAPSNAVSLVLNRCPIKVPKNMNNEDIKNAIVKIFKKFNEKIFIDRLNIANPIANSKKICKSVIAIQVR